jgi:hypothetical protein
VRSPEGAPAVIRSGLAAIVGAMGEELASELIPDCWVAPSAGRFDDGAGSRVTGHIRRHLSPPSFWMQERDVSISTSGGLAGEGRSERRVRLSLDVEIDEIDR